MPSADFLQDLAVVMIVAGFVTVIFLRLKQPLVLGYLLAGVIIGPHTPPFPLIQNQASIRTLADLGIIFLMFSLGLEFNLRKLRRVGFAALLVAAFEITVMIWVGYELGRFFGWRERESMLFGCMLSLTSSMIVIKGLYDRGELGQRHGELISAVSLFDDMFVIFLMVLLPGMAHSGSRSTPSLWPALSGLFVFLVAAVILGLLLVPIMLRRVARFKNDETLLLTTLGLCFGVSLLALKLRFSTALGAFLVGAIIAETRQAGRVAVLTTPLRDLFAAVFFTAVGMLIDPTQLVTQWKYVLIALVIYMPAKMFSCALGAFLTGYTAREGVRTGAHMAQLGEFAFVLAGLTHSLGLTNERVYPVIVSLAAANALVRPYMIEHADRFAGWISRRMPESVRETARFYSRWVCRIRQTSPRHPGLRPVRSLAWQLLLNVALLAALFAIAAFLAHWAPRWAPLIEKLPGGSRFVCWIAAALVTLPIYVATIRKLQALAMMLAEITIPASSSSRVYAIRAVFTNLLFGASLIGLAFITTALSSAILPPHHILLGLALIAVAVFFFGHRLNRWYSKAKFAVVETWTQPAPPQDDVSTLPALLKDAAMETLRLADGPSVGLMIRELEIRRRTGASVIAIERADKVLVNPGPDEDLRAGDNILLLGDQAQLARATQLILNGPAALGP